MVQRETEGPDRCRSSLNCADLHEPDPLITSSLYNCCCCNTCLHVRPSMKGASEEFSHCCRCVPRMIWLVFVPYDIEDACCQSAAVRMQYGGTEPVGGDEYPVTTYSGELHGATVTVEIGRFAYDGCAWHITATKAADGLDVDEYYEIDHDTVSCIDVDGLEIGEIEGPRDCVGTLILANDEVGRIPFQERILTEEPEFITLDPPCGDCEQVTSMLCVFGHRKIGQDHGWVEFFWFDYGVDERGWTYTDPETDAVEYIYLYENDYGECSLEFSWDGSSVLDDVVLENCSCAMKEVVTWSNGVDTIGFTIRSGKCGCWEFYCGTCRCVPRYLCVNYYSFDGSSEISDFVHNEILTWDEDDKCWYDDERNTEYGLYVALRPNTVTGDCELVAVFNGRELETTAIYDCAEERVKEGLPNNKYDPDVGFIDAEINDYQEEGPNFVWVHISSYTYDCLTHGNCLCYDQCGSTPEQIQWNFYAWNDPYLDEPGIEGECSITVTLYRFVRGLSCEYLGFFTAKTGGGETQVFKVSGGDVFLLRIVDGEYDEYTSWSHDPFTTQSCDPYYATTGTVVTGLTSYDFCANETQRYILTETE